VVVHELGGKVTVALALDGPADADALVDLFSDEVHGLESGRVELELEPHGFRWLRVRRAGRRLPPKGMQLLRGWIGGGLLAIRVAVTEEPGFLFVRAFFSRTCLRVRKHACGLVQH
jgi:hypothetical protein